MQKTMKAAFVTEFGKRLTMNELPVPQPNDDQEINTVLELAHRESGRPHRAKLA